jgi:hypothetical protein
MDLDFSRCRRCECQHQRQRARQPLQSACLPRDHDRAWLVRRLDRWRTRDEDGGRRNRGGPDCPAAARFTSASGGHQPAGCGAADQRNGGHVEKCIALPTIVPASLLRDARLCGPEIAHAAAKTDYGKVHPINREHRSVYKSKLTYCRHSAD